MIHSWRTDETDAATRGSTFGTACREQISATLAEYEALFHDRDVAAELVRELSENTRALVAEHAPSILREIDAMAIAAGIEPWQAMAVNARTEILARAAVVDECSTAVLLPADGSAPHTVQTWDWYAQMAADTVVRVQPAGDDARVVTYCEFGQVAKIGLNTLGLGVHLNILAHARDGERVGVPVHVLTRMILEQASTLAQALQIIDSVPLGASTVLTVVTTEPAAACIELSPAGWAVLPAAVGQPLLHTNHFLDPRLSEGQVETMFSTSRDRLEFLTAHGCDALAQSDPVARALALASDAPGSICVDPDPRRAPFDRPETKATITLDVERAELGIHVSHPLAVSRAGWQTIRAR